MSVDVGTAVGEGAKPPANVKVQVGYGPSYQDFDFPPGTKVADVVNDELVREVLGYPTGPDAMTCVNGEQGRDQDTIAQGDQIEVIKKAGQKAER